MAVRSRGSHTRAMAEPLPAPAFPPQYELFGTVTEAARAALESVLIESIERRKEFGGMICQQGNQFFAMPPREGDTNTVDVGHRLGNKGCPEGTTAVAYYHTHPAYKGAGMNMKPDRFSPEDRGVADDFGIDAYVGSVSGLFLRYDHRLRKIMVAGPRLRNARDLPMPAPPKKRRTTAGGRSLSMA